MYNVKVLVVHEDEGYPEHYVNNNEDAVEPRAPCGALHN